MVQRAVQRARAAWARVRRQDLVLLLTLLVPVVGGWVFLALADEVSERDTQHLDERLLLALRDPRDVSDPLGPSWLEEGMRDLTALGGITVLILLTAGVSGALLLRRQLHAAALVVGTTVSGACVSIAVKSVFARPRPTLVPHLSYVATASFPSGHSMLAAVVYLTLGALLARLVPDVRFRLFVLGFALFLTFLVGVSRVYLGVHYPTDVLGGWTLGLVWAVACWLLARALQRRGKVEGPRDS